MYSKIALFLMCTITICLRGMDNNNEYPFGKDLKGLIAGVDPALLEAASEGVSLNDQLSLTQVSDTGEIQIQKSQHGKRKFDESSGKAKGKRGLNRQDDFSALASIDAKAVSEYISSAKKNVKKRGGTNKKKFSELTGLNVDEYFNSKQEDPKSEKNKRKKKERPLYQVKWHEKNDLILLGQLIFTEQSSQSPTEVAIAKFVADQASKLNVKIT